MEEQKLKELIEKAINKGWVFYGEFSTDVATESVLKLLKEQLHIPVVAPLKANSSIIKPVCICNEMTKEGVSSWWCEACKTEWI